MLYRDRHQHAAQFAAAVHLQAQFQATYRIIAIKGISEAEMFHFQGILHEEFPEIKTILPTSATTPNNPARAWNSVSIHHTFLRPTGWLAGLLRVVAWVGKMVLISGDYLCTIPSKGDISASEMPLMATIRWVVWN
jgi:hypothetical protein